MITLNGKRVRVTEIYPEVNAIEAHKANGQLYRHEYKARAPIYGLPCGSVLIKAPPGVRLWGVVD